MKKALITILTIVFAVTGCSTTALATPASKTPAAGTIPIAGATGTLDPGWMASNNSFMYRNRLINSEMGIDQRHGFVTQNVTAGDSGDTLYRIDRWFVTASGNMTATAVAGSAPFQRQMWLTDSGTPVNFTIGQRIEDVNVWDLVGTAVSLSAYLGAASAINITWTAYYANNANDFSTQTVIATGVFAVTNASGLARFSTSFILPSGAIKGVSIVFSGTSIANKVFAITGVQLEAGSSPTAYEKHPMDLEVLRCQRYLPAWRFSYGYSSPQYLSLNGMATSATTAVFPWAFPVQTRIPPTAIVTSTVGDFSVYATYGTVAKTVTALALFTGGSAYPSASGAILQATVASGLTAGVWTPITALTGDYIYFTGCEL